MLKPNSWDDLLQALAATPSRREIARVLAGFSLTGPLGWLSIQGGFGADNKRKRRKRKRRRKQRLSCAPNCSGKTCGDDGCGGSCGACAANQTCEGGTCACAAGSKPCADACVPSNVCCPACGAGRLCLSNGSCGVTCASVECPSGCLCSVPNTEGDRFCVPSPFPECDVAPQTCTSTPECPPGHHCLLVLCDAGAERRCWPLCGV
jgi:hypothetical protein